MKRFGLIGERLGHSHSKTLHGFLADYQYDLLPMPPGKVDAFMRSNAYDGMNVTIPYKKTVIPYLQENRRILHSFFCLIPTLRPILGC